MGFSEVSFRGSVTRFRKFLLEVSVLEFWEKMSTSLVSGLVLGSVMERRVLRRKFCDKFDPNHRIK